VGTVARESVQNTHHWSGWTETATENRVGQGYGISHSSVAMSIAVDQWRVFCTPSLAVVPTCCHQLDLNLANFEGHSWGAINSGVSFCNNSMVARAQWAFQLSQGGVNMIQVRWKMFTLFCSRFIHETMYQILSESPEFYRRYEIWYVKEGYTLCPENKRQKMFSVCCMSDYAKQSCYSNNFMLIIQTQCHWLADWKFPSV